MPNNFNRKFLYCVVTFVCGLSLNHALNANEGSYHYEVVVPKLNGEIYINISKIGANPKVRELTGNGKYVDLNNNIKQEMVGLRWLKIKGAKISEGSEGLVVGGTRGVVFIKEDSGLEHKRVGKAITNIDELVVRMSRLEGTIYLKGFDPSVMDKLELAILDNKRKEFTWGDIITVSEGFMAIEFDSLSREVINKDGNLRLSITTPNGSFVSSDLKAWGYDIFVSDSEIDKPASIKAKIYGLRKKDKVEFSFVEAPGQEITPLKQIFNVKEINSNKTVAEIVSTSGGNQPLQVDIKRVE